VPYKESKIEKVYYRIGEVSEMLGLTASNIRFWEAESGLVKPKKNGKGNRLFTVDDIEKLRQYQHLVRDQGMTLKGARDKIRQNPGRVSENFEIISRLQSVRQQLIDLRDKIEA